MYLVAWIVYVALATTIICSLFIDNERLLVFRVLTLTAFTCLLLVI